LEKSFTLSDRIFASPSGRLRGSVIFGSPPTVLLQTNVSSYVSVYIILVSFYYDFLIFHESFHLLPSISFLAILPEQPRGRTPTATPKARKHFHIRLMDNI